MFGRPGVTYESAQTRKFQKGRTEVIRSASVESKAWAEGMIAGGVSAGYAPRHMNCLLIMVFFFQSARTQRASRPSSALPRRDTTSTPRGPQTARAWIGTCLG